MTRPTVSPIASAVMDLWAVAALPFTGVTRLALVVSPDSWTVVPLTDSATLRVSAPGARTSIVSLPHGAPRRKTAKHVARNMLRTLRTAP